MILAVVLFTGRLLPIWMFINSLSLICHTQYFKSNMPGFLAIYLTQLLKIPRFDLIPQWREHFEDTRGFPREGAHNELFATHEYNSLYMLGTMGHLILIYLAIIVIIWCAALIKDGFVWVRGHWDANQQHKRIRGIFWLFKHEPLMHNATNRFIYEIFFEVCLCSMIAVANDAHDDTLQSLGTLLRVRLLSWPATVLVLCLIFACYVFAHYWTSLFKHFRNDKLPIFLRDMLTGMYERHLWWLTPALAKTGVCLDKCFTPLARCSAKLSDKLFGRCEATCVRLCPSRGRGKKTTK